MPSPGWKSPPLGGRVNSSAVQGVLVDFNICLYIFVGSFPFVA